jgi:hypothetical protein
MIFGGVKVTRATILMTTAMLLLLLLVAGGVMLAATGFFSPDAELMQIEPRVFNA